MKAFWTFKRSGIQFLMIPLGPNCMICDEDGNAYGSYHDQKSFEHMAEKEGGFERLRLGKVQVQLAVQR